jgi:metal-responsive CopG/Arc/MetJ family transcriptional regulator
MQNTSLPGDRRQRAAVQLRLGPLFELVENWRRSQAKIPPRSEAIRELVRRAIEAEQQHTAS